MTKIGSAIVGLLSILAPVALVLVGLFEELFYSLAPNVETARYYIDGALVVLAGLTLVLMLTFVAYVARAHDPRFSGKRGLWIAILVFGNVFAIPLFWLVFLRRSVNV